MDTTRARFGSAIEWMLAAVFILVAVAIGSLVVRELRDVSATVPAMAREAQPAAPADLPARAVSVPVLLLPGNKSVRVGDSVAAVAARLGREAEVGSQSAEPSRFGERLTRYYEHGGTRFILVFERLEAGGNPQVAAIYVQ